MRCSLLARPGQFLLSLLTRRYRHWCESGEAYVQSWIARRGR